MIGQNASLQISGLWDAAGRAGLTALDAGSEVVFILSWGTTATDGFLSITLHGIVLPGSKVSKGDIAQVDLSIKGMTDRDGTPADEMLAIELANAIDRAW